MAEYSMDLNNMKKFNKNFVPKTLTEAINYIYNLLDSKDVEFIKNNPSSSVHFSFGMAIRNEWGLWQNNTPFKENIKLKYGLFCHADDISGLIMTGIWATVRKLDVDAELQKAVDRYIKHWISYGIDPKTGKKISKSKQLNSNTVEINNDEL